MVDTDLGWDKALEYADAVVTKGNLSREDHLVIFHRMQKSRNNQDRRIAIGILKIFIDKYQDDFDKDISLDDLIGYGEALSTPYWKDYGRAVLYPVIRYRGVPAIWVDKIADEASTLMRHAFAAALEELSKLKSIPLNRILGILAYFMDEPNPDVRETLVSVMKKIASRDSQRMHYFLVEHEAGAGSSRMALIASARSQLNKKSE